MLNDKKTINAWCLYDWANSVYSLTITSAIFPIYYQTVAVNASGGDRIEFFGMEIVNSVLYSYALSASFLMVAIVLPKNRKAKRNSFLRCSCLSALFPVLDFSFLPEKMWSGGFYAQ